MAWNASHESLATRSMHDGSAASWTYPFTTAPAPRWWRFWWSASTLNHSSSSSAGRHTVTDLRSKQRERRSDGLASAACRIASACGFVRVDAALNLLGS